MFNVSVTNFKGCKSARFGVSPVALIVGLNSAGKSSALYPIACALAGQAKVFGLTKDAEKTLVPHDGAKEAAVVLSGENWGVTVTWPGGKVTAKGSAPRVSPVAAGLASVLDLTGKDRAEMLGRYINAQPTKDDWLAACKDSGVSDTRAESQWKALEDMGGVWESAFNAEKEEGAKMKGEWRAITGQQYGSEAAEGWKPDSVPEGWPTLVTVAKLEQAVQNAQAALEQELAKGGADEAERNRLKAILVPQEKVQATYKQAKGDVTKWTEAMKAAEAKLQAIPVAQKRPPKCPCCNENLLITISEGEYVVKKGGAWDENDYQRVRRMEEAAQDEFNTAEQECAKAARLMQAADRDLCAIREAKAKLEQMGDGSPGDVAGARTRLAEAQNALRGGLAAQKADTVHKTILEQAKVVKLLAPDGVRAAALVRGIKAFNETLEALCEQADWGSVALTPQLDFTHDGVPYAMMADNERFRTRVILQLAMARVDGSQAVLVDGADILDPPSRQGLFMLLKNLGLAAIVAMTMPPEKAPNLAAYGMGSTIHMVDGQATVVPPPAKAA